MKVYRLKLDTILVNNNFEKACRRLRGFYPPKNQRTGKTPRDPFPPKPSLLNRASRKNPFHACKQNDFEGRINIAPYYPVFLDSKGKCGLKENKSFILSFGKKRQEKDQSFSPLNKVKKPIRLPLENLNTLPSASGAFNWSFRIHTECEMFPRPSKWCLT